jgi:hypothetical protein
VAEPALALGSWPPADGLNPAIGQATVPTADWPHPEHDPATRVAPAPSPEDVVGERAADVETPVEAAVEATPESTPISETTEERPSAPAAAENAVSAS